MTIYHAIPAIPHDQWADEPTPQGQRLFTERAAIARFILDLLDTTQSKAA
jgi:hypothetical protein